MKQHIANLEEQNKQNAQLILKKDAEISRLNQQNQQIISNGFALNESSANLLNQSRQQIAERDARISELNKRIAQFRFDNQQLVSDNRELSRINQQLWLNNQNLGHNLNSTQGIIRNGAHQVLRKGSIHITKSALLDFAIHLHNSSNKTDVTISKLSDENTMEHDIGLQSSEKRHVTETTIPQTPMNKQTISTEKLKEKLKLPEYPEGYEKDFFDAIEEDLNIDAATAKRVRITKEKREDVISQIVEGKQFEEIKETYPKLPRFTYNECVRYIKCWFSFSEQELFKKKINGEELNKKLNPLDMGKCALDLDALAVLIRLDSSVFVEHYKNYNHKWYFDIARV